LFCPRAKMWAKLGIAYAAAGTGPRNVASVRTLDRASKYAKVEGMATRPVKRMASFIA